MLKLTVKMMKAYESPRAEAGGWKEGGLQPQCMPLPAYRG